MFTTSRNTAYLPSLYSTYGTGFYHIMNLCSQSACMQTLILERVLWARKNSRDYHCDDTEAPMNTEQCLDRFIAGKVGCSSGFQSGESTLPQCTEMDQFGKWANWTNTITKLGETSIHELTGCLGPCVSHDCKVSAVSDLTDMEKYGATKGTVEVMLGFPGSKYEVREQFYAYDGDSFIADVGGYLGLLLGHSIYSIACSLKGFSDMVKKYRIFKK